MRLWKTPEQTPRRNAESAQFPESHFREGKTPVSDDYQPQHPEQHQAPHNPQHTGQHTGQHAGYHDAYAAEPSSGMAVTSLVLGIVSLVLCPLTSIPGLILGIMAASRASETPPRASGKGMAIAGIATSALGLLFTLLLIPILIAVLLPAVGTARQSAQRLHSSSNIRFMVQAISTQSQSNNGQFPQTADDWQQNLIDANLVPADLFTSPYTDGLGDDYFFVPGGRDDFDASRVVVYEDPALNPDWTLIGYADAHVDLVDQRQSMQILSNLTLPDGTRYAPHESDPSATASGVRP